MVKMELRILSDGYDLDTELKFQISSFARGPFVNFRK